MSTVKISSEQRSYLRKRIEVLFQDAENILQDRAIGRRAEITRQALEDAGIEKAKEQASKIFDSIRVFNEKTMKDAEKQMEQIRELNKQFEAVAGTPLIVNARPSGSYAINCGNLNSFSSKDGTALGRLIYEAMSRTPEGSQIEELRIMKLSIEDRLMLDYEGKTGAEILSEVQASISSIVSRAKALPSASSPKKAGKEKSE